MAVTKPEPDPVIDQLIEKITAARQEEYADRKHIVISKLKQGAGLKKLKEKAGHGRWKSYLEMLGYHESNASRLMKLAESWFDDEIVTMGHDLVKHLPLDLQKLVKLTELTAVQARKLLKLQDFDDMSREEVRDAVDAKLLACGKKLSTRAATGVAQRRQPNSVPEHSAASEKGAAVKMVLPRTSSDNWQAQRMALHASKQLGTPPNHDEPVSFQVASAEPEQGTMLVTDGPQARVLAACQTIAELTDAECNTLVAWIQQRDGGLLRQIDGAMKTLTGLRTQLEARGSVGTVK